MKLGIAGAAALVLAFCGTARADTHVYAANCGNAHFLEYKGSSYSSGCTGGSVNVDDVYWTSWGSRAAHGAGTSLYRWAPREGAWDTYKSPGRVHLFRPVACDDHGVTKRFFSRARIGIYFYADNPIGRPKGWESHVVSVLGFDGACITTARGLNEAGGDYGKRNYAGSAILNEVSDAERIPNWLGGWHVFD